MKRVHIFDELQEEELANLKERSVTRTFRRQEIIFHKKELPQYLYVLLDGTVCVCDDSQDGVRNILTIIREPMDCFGEVYLFIDEEVPFYAEAMKKSTILMIPRSVVQDFPQLSNNLNVMLSQKAYTLSQKLKLLMKDSLREKIMEYMQQHPDIILKRHEMASFLGVSRPALSKELYRMVDDGLLLLDDHGNFKTVM